MTTTRPSATWNRRCWRARGIGCCGPIPARRRCWFCKIPGPDLALLDLMLPGLSGEELLPRLQGVSVIVVSAKAGVEHKVALLMDGAADYLTKPFDTGELLARVAARLRDRRRQPETGRYALGDPDAGDGLPPGNRRGPGDQPDRTEYAILKLLMQNPGQVLAKSVLLERISLDTPDCTESSLKTHISHLRGKLREAAGKEYVESVWGIGFRIVG